MTGDNDLIAGAVEVNDRTDHQCPGDVGFGLSDEIPCQIDFANASDKTELSWCKQIGASMYEVARSDTPDFQAPCGGTTAAATSWNDSDLPAAGNALRYLVRPSAPNAGSWGADSNGVERTGGCP